MFQQVKTHKNTNPHEFFLLSSISGIIESLLQLIQSCSQLLYSFCSKSSNFIHLQRTQIRYRMPMPSQKSLLRHTSASRVRKNSSSAVSRLSSALSTVNDVVRGEYEIAPYTDSRTRSVPPHGCNFQVHHIKHSSTRAPILHVPYRIL